MASSPSHLDRLRSGAYTWLHRLSLTQRLVTVVVLLVLAAYLLTTSVTMMMLRGYLVDRMDADLETYSQPLTEMAVSQIQSALGEPVVTQDRFVPPSPYYLLFTPADDQASSFALALPEADTAPPDLGRIPVGDPRAGEPFTVDSRDGEGRWRVLVRNTTVDGQAVGTVAVALPMSGMTSTVRQLGIFTTVIGVTTLLVVGVLAWFAVRRAFRPLSRIEDTASAIAAGDLTRRVPPGGAQDEVGSLSRSLNTMLAQIERSFGVREASEQRMRDFVADASHELRTPLATVRGYAELYRVGGIPRTEDVGVAMRRIEDEATRMARLVEDLLTLTRWDTGDDREMSPSRVDLTPLAADAVQDAQVRAPDRELDLVGLTETTGAEPIVLAEDGAMRQVLTNLVANAISHTPAGTPVEVALGHVGEHVVLEVRDHGPGLDEETAARVFERFYRADKSRSRASGGTGLGLAIVAAIVARHDGTVSHRPTPGGGATFRVELPAVGPEPTGAA